jgi:hypothetical protein
MHPYLNFAGYRRTRLNLELELGLPGPFQVRINA